MTTRKFAYDLAFPDEAARLAFVPQAGDVGKVARQFSDATYWALLNHDPVSWGPLTGSNIVMAASQAEQDAAFAADADFVVRTDLIEPV